MEYNCAPNVFSYFLRDPKNELKTLDSIQSIVSKVSQTGENYNSAIVIKGLSDYDATQKIYKILYERFGTRDKDWKLVGQSFKNNEIGMFDEMTIELANGDKKLVYFNITDTFGKGLL